MKRPRVLAIGPLSGTVTGQLMAFKKYVERSAHDVEVIDSNAESVSKWNKAMSTLRVCWLATQRLLFAQVDAIYITTSRSRLGAVKDLYVLCIAQLCNVPVINHLHGADFKAFRSELGFLYRLLLDCAYRSIKVSVVLNEKFLEQYDAYPEMKLEVVENFVDEAVIHSVGAKPVDRSRMRVLYLSNLCFRKGVLDLVAAMDKVEAVRPSQCVCQIVGAFIDDQYVHRDKFEECFNVAINNKPYIEFSGFLSGDQKFNAILEADVFCLPTFMRGEAVPLSLLEAAGGGCYVVVSDFGILPALVSEMDATVVKPGSPDEIADALVDLLDDRTLLTSARQRNPQVVANKYGVDRYVNSLDGLIGEACQ